MGQVSSKYAARNAYKIGRRPIDNPDATLLEVLEAIDKKSSVNMATTDKAMSALGAIPVVGDAARKSIKVYHGGSFKGGEVDAGKTQRANLGIFYSTTDKESANNFSKSGFFDDDTVDASRGGSVFEFDVFEDDLIDLDSFSSSEVIDSIGRDEMADLRIHRRCRPRLFL